MLFGFKLIATYIDVLGHFLVIESEVGTACKRIITFNVKVTEIDHDVKTNSKIEKAIVN